MRTFLFALFVLVSVCYNSSQAQSSQPFLSSEDSLMRLKSDFCKTHSQILSELSAFNLHTDPKQIERWENELKLEMRIIDGQKMYFRNAVSNLFRLDSAANAERVRIAGPDKEEDVWKRVPRETALLVCKEKEKDGLLFAPRDFDISFHIKIPRKSLLSEDSVLKCWMPAPHSYTDRQKSTRLIATSPAACVKDLNNEHASVYFEQVLANQMNDIQLESQYSFTSYAQHYSLPYLFKNAQPVDTLSELYTYYTREQQKHIRFTPEIESLASTLKDSASDVQTIKNIFDYISDNIPWCSAVEYCNIDNIPMYVLRNRHGDCGQVSLLFITLCRRCGIPAKWQSGWMLHPGAENLHDWTEVYLGGIGWIPVDVSFGRIDHPDPDIAYFYLGGIDPYRMIVNQDFSADFSPRKSFYRSEPVDFQRGEVESNVRNLYFNEWRYKMSKNN
ncbi:MAG: transglutaminase-like domain-containing protein [Bacteroidales bacterium]